MFAEVFACQNDGNEWIAQIAQDEYRDLAQGRSSISKLDAVADLQRKLEQIRDLRPAEARFPIVLKLVELPTSTTPTS